MQAELDAQGLWIHRKHEALAEFFGAIPKAVAHAKAHSASVVAVLAEELRLGGGPFLLGETFSAADILFVSCLDWAASIGWVSWDGGWSQKTPSPVALHRGMDFQKGVELLGPYIERCHSRPAYLRVAAMKKAKSSGSTL